MQAGISRAWLAVAGSSAKDIWIVGSLGGMLHYDGQSFTQVPTGVTSNLYGLWVNGPRDVWAVGDVGTVIHFDGTTWQTIPVDLSLKTTIFRATFSPGPDEV